MSPAEPVALALEAVRTSLRFGLFFPSPAILRRKFADLDQKAGVHRWVDRLVVWRLAGGQCFKIVPIPRMACRADRPRHKTILLFAEDVLAAIFFFRRGHDSPFFSKRRAR